MYGGRPKRRAIPEFPFKRNNYPDWQQKARECFTYLANLPWDSPERLTINAEEYPIKNLSKLTAADFAFKCPAKLFENGLEDPVLEKYYITINSVDTDYDNMNIFSDLFNEEPRMNANVIGKMSPMQFWQRNYDKIKNEVLFSRQELTNYNLREMLYIQFHNGRGECTTFRPAILFALIRIFGAKTMLDPSSGWGDRLFAALAAGLDFYIGVDPNTALIKGYNKMIELFDPNRERARMVCSGFEDFTMDRMPIQKVDLVFTSPAYFTIEKYSNEATQSINKFRNEKEWTENFLLVMFDKAVEYTRSGGIIALNIEMMDGKHSYIYRLLEHGSADDRVVYCGIISYKGSRHSAHAPIFIWSVK